MLGFLGLLLVIWIVFILLGAFIHALFWLLIVGVVLLLATGAIGFVKREALSRRH